MNLRFITVCSVFGIGSFSLAQTTHFTPGRLVFTQVGSETLTANGNTVAIREVVKTGSSVTPTTLFSMPTATITGTVAANNIVNPTTSLVQAGNSTSEGFITRSTSGRFLGIVGYAGTWSSSLTSSASTSAHRIVGRLDFAGGINVSTRMTNAHSGSNIRAGVWTETPVTDGTNLRYRAFTVGGAGGVVATILGSTSGTSVSTQMDVSGTPTGSTNLRVIKMINGDLYFSSGSTAGSLGIRRLSGLPTSATVASRTIITDTTANGQTSHSQPYGFVFIKTTETISGTPTEVYNCYIADDSGTDLAPTTGGIWKYQSTTGLNGTYSQKYKLTATRCRHLCTDGKVIYATTAGTTTGTPGSTNQILQLIDGGSGTTANTTEGSLISSVTGSQSIRGIELSPEPAIVGSQYTSSNTAGNVMVLRQDDGIQRSLRVGLNPDSGHRSWTDIKTVYYDGHAVKTASDASGNVYIAIQSEDVSNSNIVPTIRITKVPKDGSSSITSSTINLATGDEAFAITVDSSNRPVIAYRPSTGAQTVKFVRWNSDLTTDASYTNSGSGFSSGSKTPIDIAYNPNSGKYLTTLFATGNTMSTTDFSSTFSNSSPTSDLALSADLNSVAVTPLSIQFGSDNLLRVLSVGSTTATRALLRVDTLKSSMATVDTAGTNYRRDATGTPLVLNEAAAKASATTAYLWALGLSMNGDLPCVLMTGIGESTTGPSGVGNGSTENIIGSGKIWTMTSSNAIGSGSKATASFAPGFSPVN